MRDCFIRRDERAWMGRTQRVTDFAAPFATDFQPEPWQILQTVDEEVTEGILKKIGWSCDSTMGGGRRQGQEFAGSQNAKGRTTGLPASFYFAGAVVC